VNEAAFTREVLALAARLGLLAHWNPDSRRCEGAPGFPDLVIAGEAGIGLAECKMPGGDTSAGQDLWLWTLARSISPRVAFVRVWEPADLASGLIERDLRRIAGTREPCGCRMLPNEWRPCPAHAGPA
jgi:hypothetical protein